MVIETKIEISGESLEKFTSLVANKVAEKLNRYESKEAPEYFSKVEAAKYLNVSPNTLDKYINKGLEVHIIDDDLAVRLSRKSIDTFMSKHMIKGDKDNGQK